MYIILHPIILYIIFIHKFLLNFNLHCQSNPQLQDCVSMLRIYIHNYNMGNITYLAAHLSIYLKVQLHCDPYQAQIINNSKDNTVLEVWIFLGRLYANVLSRSV